MIDEVSVKSQVKTELLIQLQRLQCTVVETLEEQAGERITVISPAGNPHDIYIRLLNLDKGRRLKLTKADFNYELRDNLWILLVLYMEDMQPILYLIPSKVFQTPNDIFLNNEQLPVFRHLSTWEINVFTKAIPELSQHTLASVVMLP